MKKEVFYKQHIRHQGTIRYKGAIIARCFNMSLGYINFKTPLNKTI